jgi:DNA-directed RNA polymerase specialized sigma24 family protein
MKKDEEDRLKRELGEIWPALTSFALGCLWSWCPDGGQPRLHDTAKAYAKRVVDELEKPPKENREAYVAAAKARIEELITDNEMKLRALTADTDWNHAVLVAIAAAVKKYGSGQILDREVQDWIQEAALQFLNRSRHFDANRPKKVKLASWLLQSARSNIAHARRDQGKHPHEPFDDRRGPDGPGGGRTGEDSDAGSDEPSDDGDDDDADLARRSSSVPIPPSTGVRPNARLHLPAAR